MRTNVYSEYRKSEIPWIENIPESWNESKLKYLLERIQTGTTPTTKNNEYFNGNIKWFTPGDFKEEKNLDNSARKVSDLAINDGVVRLQPKGCVLLVSIGATLGKVAMLSEEATFNQQITGLITNKLLHPDYLYYWLKINRETILNIANYTTLPIINNQFIKDFYIMVPPKNEQEQIAYFLEVKTTEINSLISDKEKLIELLEEKRQAVITEVVTKGLKSDVKMENSGIEWIRKIPEHWDKTKIKYTSYVKGRIGWQGLRSDEFIDEGPYLVTGTDFQDGIINWDSCYHISEERYNEAPPIQLKENDLLITKDGTIGKVAIVKNKPDKAILNSGVFVTRSLQGEYLTEFMYWLLNSDIFTRYIKFTEMGSTIKHLYQETFINFSYPLPNLNEQKEICHYLNENIREIDTVVTEINNQIEKLKEYRQSLIYEAVTGKIDVRDYKDNLSKLGGENDEN